MATRSEEPSTQAADTATGAAVEAAEVISDPAGSASRQVHRLERSGAPVNRRLRRQVRRAAEQAVGTTGKLLNGSFTEDLVLRGLHLVKDQARRGDLVGFAAYRSLELLHGGFGSAARSLSRFQDASQPPARPTKEGRRAATRGRTRTRKPTAVTASRGRTDDPQTTAPGANRARRTPRRAASQPTESA
jgi:hypothetical protein